MHEGRRRRRLSRARCGTCVRRAVGDVQPPARQPRAVARFTRGRAATCCASLPRPRRRNVSAREPATSSSFRRDRARPRAQGRAPGIAARPMSGRGRDRSARSHASRPRAGVCCRFSPSALTEGLRCVRVIHGKGLRSGPGGPVLKSLVHHWLRRSRASSRSRRARRPTAARVRCIVLLRGRRVSPGALTVIRSRRHLVGRSVQRSARAARPSRKLPRGELEARARARPRIELPGQMLARPDAQAATLLLESLGVRAAPSVQAPAPASAVLEFACHALRRAIRRARAVGRSGADRARCSARRASRRCRRREEAPASVEHRRPRPAAAGSSSPRPHAFARGPR